MNGQNGMSYSLLHGIALKAPKLQKMFIDSFIKEANINISAKDKERVMQTLSDNLYKAHPELFDEIQAFKLRELSLQEEVNLAYLLLKVEMDFQKYTQDIPTIGGVIRIATIDSSGYTMISGNNTISPI